MKKVNLEDYLDDESGSKKSRKKDSWAQPRKRPKVKKFKYKNE